MDRKETFEYLKERVQNNKRIVVPRYGDGEYMLMTGNKGVAKEKPSVVGPLLEKSLRVKNQLVCTTKALNRGKGIWYHTCKYVMDHGEHKLYGAGAWIRWDLKRNSDVLPYIFRGKVLIVAGFGNEAKDMFKDIQPGVRTYIMPKKQASNNYKKALNDILKICGQFDNILFACGPIGKVLLSNIINKTNANLVDIGSLLPAILSKNDKSILKTWSMSGYKPHSDLDRIVDNLLKKI